jgi:hypothetical protein
MYNIHEPKTPKGENCTMPRQLKVLTSKLAEGGGTSFLSPLRLDGSRDGHVGGWTPLMMARDALGEGWKQLQEAKEPT